jgi:hypothetical protein
MSVAARVQQAHGGTSLIAGPPQFHISGELGLSSSKSGKMSKSYRLVTHLFFC